METTYTARQAAAALRVGKSTVLRNLDKLPPEMTAQGSYRGQPTKLVTLAGIQRLSMLLSVSQIDYAALNDAPRSVPSAQTSESSEAKQGAANQADLIAELRARIAAQEKEITAKNEQISSLTEALAKAQDATATAQALHAATAEQLRLLTAARDTQGEQEPPTGTDTTPAEDDAQEPQEAHVEAGTANAEIPVATGTDTTARASLRDRLRYLFRGW